jgi:hypothetical protein
MLSWQVGRVKITRIVEMDLPVPARLLPWAAAEELRKSAWLYPHFVSEDDTHRRPHRSRRHSVQVCGVRQSQPARISSSRSAASRPNRRVTVRSRSRSMGPGAAW